MNQKEQIGEKCTLEKEKRLWLTEHTLAAGQFGILRKELNLPEDVRGVNVIYKVYYIKRKEKKG